MGPRPQANEAEFPPAQAVNRPADEALPDGLCGDFNIRIARDGTWFYRGSPIGRLALCRLFATVLHRKEDGSYWLTTPAESGRIEVEDAPFIGVALMREGSGRGQTLRIRTNLDDVVPLDAEHPLRVAESADGTPRPYVFVRRGLEARLARPVFYEMVEMAEPDPATADVLGVWSAGIFFRLGRCR
jgi:hypothetical protein